MHENHPHPAKTANANQCQDEYRTQNPERPFEKTSKGSVFVQHHLVASKSAPGSSDTDQLTETAQQKKQYQSKNNAHSKHLYLPSTQRSNYPDLKSFRSDGTVHHQPQDCRVNPGNTRHKDLRLGCKMAGTEAQDHQKIEFQLQTG